MEPKSVTVESSVVLELCIFMTCKKLDQLLMTLLKSASDFALHCSAFTDLSPMEVNCGVESVSDSLSLPL